MNTEKKLTTFEKIASEFTLSCYNNSKKDNDPARQYVVVCPHCFSRTVCAKDFKYDTVICQCGHSFDETLKNQKDRFIYPNFDKSPRFYLRHSLSEKNGKLRCFVHLAEMAAYKGHFRWRDVCYMSGINLSTGRSYLFGPLYGKQQGNNRKQKAGDKTRKKELRFNALFSKHTYDLSCTTVNYSQRIVDDICQKIVEILSRDNKSVAAFYPKMENARLCIGNLIRNPSMTVADQQLLSQTHRWIKLRQVSAETQQFFSEEYEELYTDPSLTNVLVANYLQTVFSFKEYEQLRARLSVPEPEVNSLPWNWTYADYPQLLSGEFLRRFQPLLQTIFQHIRKNRREFLAPLLDPDIDIHELIKFLAYQFSSEMNLITKTQVRTWKQFKTIVDLYNYLKVMNFIDERTAA